MFKKRDEVNRNTLIYRLPAVVRMKYHEAVGIK